MNVFFDVLDTLLSEEDIPRPHTREVFRELKEMGHEVYLWSSGGGAYAVEAAELLGVADLVKGCFGKRHEPDVRVDFAVDDDASVVESYGGFFGVIGGVLRVTGGILASFLGLSKRFIGAVWALIGVIGRVGASRAASEEFDDVCE